MHIPYAHPKRTAYRRFPDRLSMSAVFASLIPTFLIIATGWLCRTTGFVTSRQWAGLERMTYVIFFPALIIDTLSRADSPRCRSQASAGRWSAAILTWRRSRWRSGRFWRAGRHRRTELHLDLSGRDAVEHFRRPVGRRQPVRPARRGADRGGDRRHGAASQSAGVLRVHPVRRAARARARMRSCARSPAIRSSGPARSGSSSTCWSRRCRSRWRSISN